MKFEEVLTMLAKYPKKTAYGRIECEEKDSQGLIKELYVCEHFPYLDNWNVETIYYLVEGTRDFEILKQLGGFIGILK